MQKQLVVVLTGAEISIIIAFIRQNCVYTEEYKLKFKRKKNNQSENLLCYCFRIELTWNWFKSHSSLFDSSTQLLARILLQLRNRSHTLTQLLSPVLFILATFSCNCDPTCLQFKEILSSVIPALVKHILLNCHLLSKK